MFDKTCIPKEWQEPFDGMPVHPFQWTNIANRKNGKEMGASRSV